MRDWSGNWRGLFRALMESGSKLRCSEGWRRPFKTGASGRSTPVSVSVGLVTSRVGYNPTELQWQKSRLDCRQVPGIPI